MEKAPSGCPYALEDFYVLVTIIRHTVEKRALAECHAEISDSILYCMFWTKPDFRGDFVGRNSVGPIVIRRRRDDGDLSHFRKFLLNDLLHDLGNLHDALILITRVERLPRYPFIGQLQQQL